tara:strand:+ start:288 stop:596 length:309 start_codon:yes stop_codon:yes gene_type:complete
MLTEQVKEIANNINNGIEGEDGFICGFEYLEDALDIEYIVDSNKQYLGARILVAFGGPNIWVNTRTKTVEGYWWGQRAEATYLYDEIGLDEACEEIWGVDNG